MPPIPLKGGRLDTPTRRLVTKGAERVGGISFIRVDVYGAGQPVGATPLATVHIPRRPGQRWFQEDQLLQAVTASLSRGEDD